MRVAHATASIVLLQIVRFPRRLAVRDLPSAQQRRNGAARSASPTVGRAGIPTSRASRGAVENKQSGASGDAVKRYGLSTTARQVDADAVEQLG